MTSVGAYLALTKPRLLPLVLLSGFPALVMAAGGWPPAQLLWATLIGTAIAAGAANALNSYLERERDALMERTRTRPLPAGALSARSALAFGLALSVLGTACLWLWTGPTAALIALGAILFYVFVYTIWLKPRTPAGVILGGVSGAIAPLIADAAVDGVVGPAGWFLFAIIFLWQPPHFYAISLYRLREYERAGFPMLPHQIGNRATRWRIIAWVLALVPVTLAATLWTPLGALYAGAAAILGGWFAFRAVCVFRRPQPEEARGFFRASLVYLMGLFMAMICDLTVHLLWAGGVS
jgi:protoheme IX farnesyltransferase